jgi:hypothetical protein
MPSAARERAGERNFGERVRARLSDGALRDDTERYQLRRDRATGCGRADRGRGCRRGPAGADDRGGSAPAVYRSRQNVNAVVHTHSPFATTLAALYEPVPAVHYILARAATTVLVTPYHRYGTPELAAACIRTLGRDNGVLLANHGVVAVGEDLAQAMVVAEAIEYTAEITWRPRRSAPQSSLALRRWPASRRRPPPTVASLRAACSVD